MWRRLVAEVRGVVRRTAVDSLVHVQRVDMEAQLKEQRSVDRRTTAGPTKACDTSRDQSADLHCEG